MTAVDLDLARLTPEATPAALAAWHRDHRVDDEIIVHGSWYGPVTFGAVAEGAGAEVISGTSGLGRSQWTLRRELTLPDLVAPLLRVLVVGLNPSIYSAERGVAFARPGNRFWPAAIAAGLTVHDRDPWAAFGSGIGFTDLVKRASARADGLTRDEYTVGADRVRALAEWLAPKVVCFAGLTGYRKAIDPTAAIGQQPDGFGGAIAYVMPNPSGVNAHSSLADHTAHITTGGALAS